MQLLKQSTDYNCGVFALHFLLLCQGIVADPIALESALDTTEDRGTSHESLLAYLKDYRTVSAYDASLAQLSAHLPAIVNYQYTEDGHYGVVLSITASKVILYNPFTGEIELLDKNDFFTDWYSDLYGNRWFLSIV